MLLFSTHRENRVLFAEKCICNATDWSKVIFSNEKKFNLDGPDGIYYYWHDLRNDKEYFSKRQQGRGSVMLWGAFSANGKLNLAFIEELQDSTKYQKTLENNLLLKWSFWVSKEFIFQQDNATIHTSSSTKTWLARNNINVLDWPACSPDINPIENRKIYGFD